jgi:site-specific DNA recombinase
MIRAATTKRAPATIAAVSYVRMSTDKQEDSPEQQRDEIRALAAREGLKVLREYYDGGISGTESDKRHDFKRLIKDAQERHDFTVILCRDQDRFSRFDPLEANHYWFLLRQAGVRIVTARQGELNFDELAGWLTASITQHGKAQYIRDISANVLGARLRNAQQGKWTHNRAPYGYERTKDGALVLADDERVKTVRWIYRTYSDRDISLGDMAAELNRMGAPSPTEKGWKIATIQHILHRTAYLGQVEQFKQRKGKFFTVSGGRVMPVRSDDPVIKPKTDWMIEPIAADRHDREQRDHGNSKLIGPPQQSARRTIGIHIRRAALAHILRRITLRVVACYRHRLFIEHDDDAVSRLRDFYHKGPPGHKKKKPRTARITRMLAVKSFV